MFNRDIAAGITFTGRFLNKYTGKKIAEYLKEKYGIENALTYADTDSIFSSTIININNLYKVEYEDGSIEYLIKEELKKLSDNTLEYLKNAIDKF